MPVDPRTPVLVGVGQFTERIDDPAYRGMSAVELATAAAEAALADTGADKAEVAKAIDTVFGLRQFEISGPMPATLGKSNNYPRSVMNRLGGDPARVVLEPVGGQGPQKLVTEAGNLIVAGDADVVMIMGSEPGSTAKYFADRDDKPDFTENVDGQLEDRGHQIYSYIDEYTVTHGLTGAPVQYGLLDNARRSRLGLGVAEYRHQMAQLFAPMSKVAAKNPFSSSPVERSVEEVETVTDENRMICDPYPRLLVARDTVNQGAAAVLMSVEAARRIGVPEQKWVYVHGTSDLIEQPPSMQPTKPSGWQAWPWTISPPSISTAASRFLSSSSARRSACRSMTRVVSRSPGDCRTSVARGTATHCTVSPRRSLRCGTSQGSSALWAPTAAS